MQDRLAYYRGKAIEDMTREELIDALNDVYAMFQRQLLERDREQNIMINLLRVTAR